jgi:hypothetical protein
MKLSKDTVGLFKNFAGINSNLLLKQGHLLFFFSMAFWQVLTLLLFIKMNQLEFKLQRQVSMFGLVIIEETFTAEIT